MYSFILSFFSFYSFSNTAQNYPKPFCFQGEFVEPPQSLKPIMASSYELRPGFIAMVQEQAFLGLDYENRYTHLQEFQQLCACNSVLA